MEPNEHDRFMSNEHEYDELHYGPPPPRPSTSAVPPGRKRSADHLEDDELLHNGEDQLEGDVKDEDSPAGASNSSGAHKANLAARKKGAHTAPSLKRGTACMLCRKRKLRCDGIRPKCGTCHRLSHECVYGDPAQEKTKELERRIRSLEAELEGYRRGEFAPASASAVRDHSTTRPGQDDLEAAERSGSHGRPQHDRSASFPSLKMPAADHRGGEFPSPLDSQFPGYPAQPFTAPPPHHTHPHSQHQQPLESPYLAFQPQHVDNARSHPPFGRNDSESFVRPRSHTTSTAPNGADFVSRLAIPGSSHDSVSPGVHQSPTMIPQAHLQSFPFPMNPTPQLSDLINPQHYSPVAPHYPSHPPNGVDNGSPGSLHQISPVGGGPSLANGYGYPGVPLTAANLAAGEHLGRQPYDRQSGLASPGRNGMSLGGTADDMTNGGLYGAKKENGDVISTIWSAAELPEIDLMVELANMYFSTIHQHLPFLHRPRFLYTLRHPASLTSPPSLSLIFAVLAIAAAYHDSPQIRACQTRWYNAAREKVEVAIQAGVRPAGGRIASLTVEMVQALALLALLEMGQSDHQRAFLSIGQAVRIAAMLGLHRMDEDRLSQRCGTSGDKRLRPPALHELPTDGVLLEECRRTMCAVFVIDRFEQGCVGWPSAIAEPDLRILLPCDEVLYENGICSSEDNPMWWPTEGLEAEDAETTKPGNERKKVGTFAWLCRAVWVGGRVQLETYRPSGPPAGGPWNKNVAADPLFTTSDMLEMDKLLDFVRSKLGQLAAMKASQHKGVDGPVIMTLLLVNCLFVNLHHLRASTGLQQLPFDPTAPIFIGTAEYSLQRCWEAIHSLHEIVSQLAGYENSRTSLHRSRINTFTSFVPYVLYCVAFPAKYAIGDWTALVNSRDRTENVPAHSSRVDIPRGDDVFPPSYFETRLKMVDALCDAMERVGAVWPIGHKFATMVSGDRIRLAERTYQRDQQEQRHAQYPPASSTGTGGGGSNQNTPVSQSSQRLHPHHAYQTSPTLQSDTGY
ncbi:hypothetical protein JCM11491_000254 [Sporobolomyces phaffii]